MLHASAIFVIETFVVGRTAAAQAVAAVAGNFIPNLPERPKREIAERAVGRGFAPLADRTELLQLLILVEEALAAGEGQIESPQAEVIPPTFHEHCGEFARDHRVQKRQIFADELLLQTNGMRRDDDLRRGRPVVFSASTFALAYFRFSPCQNRRHQISKALTDTCAGLSDKMMLGSDRA